VRTGAKCNKIGVRRYKKKRGLVYFFGKMYNFSDKSGVFSVTDGYNLAVKVFKKF
jgi:hypothetical protein